MKSQEEEENSTESNYTASSLPVTNVKKQCVFCSNSGHFSDQCRIVTDNTARRNILKKKRRCFRCFKGSHMAKTCKVYVKCYKCKIIGNHHTALYEGVKKLDERFEISREEENFGQLTACLVD